MKLVKYVLLGKKQHFSVSETLSRKPSYYAIPFFLFECHEMQNSHQGVGNSQQDWQHQNIGVCV